MKAVLLLLARVAIGGIFVYHGWGKLTNLEMVAGFFGKWGFPVPSVMAGLVGLVEFVGGLALILGIYARMAAKLLGVVMIVALLAVHLRFGDNVELPLALLGALLALSVSGAGAWRAVKNQCCCGVDPCQPQGGACGCGKGGCTGSSCGDKPEMMGSACGSHEDKMKNGDACCQSKMK